MAGIGKSHAEFHKRVGPAGLAGVGPRGAIPVKRQDFSTSIPYKI